MFAEGVNEARVDVVDEDPQDQNDHVLDHSFGEGISVLYDHAHVCCRPVHLWTGLTLGQGTRDKRRETRDERKEMRDKK